MPNRLRAARTALLRLRAILFRQSLNDEMQAEMREHLDRATARLVARGMTEAEARLEARREFGNVTVHQEDAREARGSRWLDGIIGDARFALRYFGRHKATTVIIIAVIALGTGANTLIFSVFQSEFTRPAPAVPEISTHARVWAQERPTRTARWERRGFSLPELVRLAERREIFSDVAAWKSDKVILDGGDSTGARAVNAQFITSNFFTVLGVNLSAGQGLRRDAGDAPDMTAIMAYEMAERLYGNAAAAVGHRILVNEVPVHVVGVAPPRFQGAVRHMDEPALWIPLSARADIARISPRWLIDEPSLSVFARLAPNASNSQATALARQVVTGTLPDSAARVGMARTADVLGMQAPPPGEATNEMALAFTFILVIGALILLVAWTNVSSLMVAAAVARRHEIAVRLSLGASRARLLRQLVTESTLLALTGSAIGLTLAWWQLVYMEKTEIDAVTVTPDAGTFAFVLLMALATGILFGLSPALHATRTGVASALRDSGSGTSSRSRLQRGFVIAQIALSQPLLLLLGTMLLLITNDYKPLAPEMSSRVVTVAFRPLTNTGAQSQRVEAVDSLIPRIAERAEVREAVPDASAFAVRGVVAPGRRVLDAKADTAPTIVHVEGAAPGWLGVVDVPIVLGRDVSLGDTAASNYPVVIGSDLARALFGNANPIGQTLASPPLHGLEQDSMTMSVVGVYNATRSLPGMTWGGANTSTDTPARVFTARGKKWRHDFVLVRTRGPAAPFMPELQRFLRLRAPSMPVESMRTLAQADDEAYAAMLRMSAMAGGGGALALLLASLGLYGVISLAVRQRTREIGIRIAVGALPSWVVQMFLKSGVRTGLIGLAIGLPISVAALKIGMAQGLFLAPNVNPYAVGMMVAIVLMAVASLATWLPARRAAQVDPARTLRVE
jgi:predicted permease